MSNYAISGQFCANMIIGSYGKTDPTYSPNTQWNIAAWFCGTNDLNITDSNGRTPQQVFDYLAAWNTGRHRQGFKTIVLTEPYRAGTGYLGGLSDTIRKQFNSLIYANAESFDAIVDLGQDANLGNANGMKPGGTYSSDGIHFTPLGHAYVASLVAQAINSLTSDAASAGYLIPVYNSYGKAVTFTDFTRSASGAYGIGASNPQIPGGLDVGYGLRVSGAPPLIASGAGVEIVYTGAGMIQTFNRSAGHWDPTNIDGSQIILAPNSGGLVDVASGWFQIQPRTFGPPCTATANIGTIWFDNTTNTTVEKHCVSVGGTMTWVIK